MNSWYKNFIPDLSEVISPSEYEISLKNDYTFET